MRNLSTNIPGQTQTWFFYIRQNVSFCLMGADPRLADGTVLRGSPGVDDWLF
jgi:hypothetical protein